MAQQAISLKPDDMATGGGGILSDTNVRFDTVRFGMESYKGKSNPVPALMIDYTDLDSEEKFQQSWSVGNPSDYTPSKDGKQLIGDKAVRASSNFGMLLTSLANTIGGDEFNEHITDDITVLEGMECHIFQQPDDRPTAKSRKDPKTGKEYPATIPVVDRVMVKPWDKKGSKGAKSAPADNTDLKTKAAELVKQALADKPDGLNKADLAMAVFHAADTASKTDLVALISNDVAFVSGIDGVVVENDVFKLG